MPGGVEAVRPGGERCAVIRLTELVVLPGMNEFLPDDLTNQSLSLSDSAWSLVNRTLLLGFPYLDSADGQKKQYVP